MPGYIEKSSECHTNLLVGKAAGAVDLFAPKPTVFRGYGNLSKNANGEYIQF